MSNYINFKGTIHPSTLGRIADGVNVVSQSFIFKTHFNGKNTIREQKSSYRELACFCQVFERMWEEELTHFSKFMSAGKSDRHMQWYNHEYGPCDNIYGELTLSDEGVRLFKNEDGWTLLVSLDLFDLTPFKVYKAIGRCLHFMDEFSLHYLIFEDDLIHRAERKYKEWLEKKESDIINNNNEDEDCPF